MWGKICCPPWIHRHSLARTCWNIRLSSIPRSQCSSTTWENWQQWCWNGDPFVGRISHHVDTWLLSENHNNVNKFTMLMTKGFVIVKYSSVDYIKVSSQNLALIHRCKLKGRKESSFLRKFLSVSAVIQRNFWVFLRVCSVVAITYTCEPLMLPGRNED